jgi:hypothetical protein
MFIRHYIEIEEEKYYYAFEKNGDGTVFFQCESANIAQDFLCEDFLEFLIDLPHLILEHERSNNN